MLTDLQGPDESNTKVSDDYDVSFISSDPLFSSLTDSEKEELSKLASMLAASSEKARRHSGLEAFIQHLSLVHQFVCKGDKTDYLRGIVCGVQFGGGFILVNTSRLKQLLFRSKSCMNGCFQRLGYTVIRPPQEIIMLFRQLMPSIDPSLFAIRQWCVRIVSDHSPICFPSNLPPGLSAKIGFSQTNSTKISKSRQDPAENVLIDQSIYTIDGLLNRPLKN